MKDQDQIVSNVKTNSGIIEYKKSDIQEMLDNPKLYACADNLPKWLGEQDKSKVEVKKILTELLNSKKPIYINVSQQV